MMCGRGILSSILNNNNINVCAEFLDQGKTFLENGSILLEELIAFSNGRYNTPIRRFSVEELHRATEGFSSGQVLIDRRRRKIYKGYLENHPIFIKNYAEVDSPSYYRTMKFHAIRDLVIMTLMSSHKNVVKILGCCIGLKIPALVCEYAGSIELSSHLYDRKGGNVDIDGPLSWKSRLKIANDIANAVVYLHTAFPMPIIHRDLRPENILIDKFGVAKLMDFSFSIAMPPGETQVEDVVVGAYGFADPEYVETGFLNHKSDVFGFGMLLLELLTGKRAVDTQRGDSHKLLNNYVKDYVDKGQFNEVVDPRILKGGAIEQEQQLQALAALALRCVEQDRESRPEMINMAKELKRIQSGKCNTIRSFSAEELIKAKNNFNNCAIYVGISYTRRGSLQNHSIIFKTLVAPHPSYDIEIASQMSHWKKVLKLLACCLEFESPSLVYEYSGPGTTFQISSTTNNFPGKIGLRLLVTLPVR